MFRLVVSLVAVLFVLSGCADKGEPEEAETEPVVSVEAAAVLTAPIELKVSGEGVLYPVQQESITPKITAPIRAFHVNKGSVVRSGQVLAELESLDLIGAVAESQAALDQAEANYQATSRVSLPQETQKAELDVRAAKEAVDAQQKRFNSVQDLYKQGAIAQRVVDEAQVSLTQVKNELERAQRVLQDLQGVAKDQSLKASEAQRDAAKSRLQTSQVQLGYAKVVSHIDGVVTDRPFYVGETAPSDRPLLTIMDLSSVIARVHVSQEDATQFKVGDAANLYPVEAAGKAVRGKVTQISAALDPANTTVEVWVQAANREMKMRAGTSIHVEIVPRVVPDALVVPEMAVVTSGSGATSVFVVGAGDKPVKQEVKLGIHEAGRVQVVEGVKSGDRVVVKGAYDLSKLESDVLEKTKLAIQPTPEPPDPEEEDEK